MAEARDGADHEARVQRPERLGVEAVALEAADLEVLDDDVGLGREAPDQGPTLGGLEIGRDAALAAVAAVEIGGAEVARLAAVPGSDEGRSPLARVVAAAGALHLDHVGPEIRQQLPAPGPGQDTGQFEDADAVEGWRGSRNGHGMASAESTGLRRAGVRINRPDAAEPGSPPPTAAYRGNRRFHLNRSEWVPVRTKITPPSSFSS